jgi:anti-anti-sigma regulatory factor
MLRLERDGGENLRVVGAATVYEAEGFKAALLEVLAEERESWVLDLGGLTALDTAGLQLLMAFRRSANVSVHSCPENIRIMVDRIGLLAKVV